MPVDDIERRKKLTFEQAEGLAPLPHQLALTEVSPELRAVLWSFVHGEIEKSSHNGAFGRYVGDPWRAALKSAHVYRDHGFADEFSNALQVVTAKTKKIFATGSYFEIYGWLQFIMSEIRHPEFAHRIANILKYCRAPYRVVDGKVICPIGSEAEGASITKSFEDLDTAGLTGARNHLLNAAKALSVGKFPDSIRESIHAVESVAKSLEPSGDLSKALARLETSAKIHGALRAGFLSLYGYTSDSEGIRHALIDKGAAEVDETDALFMMGACAAFVSYLVNKGRAAGLVK